MDAYRCLHELLQQLEHKDSQYSWQLASSLVLYKLGLGVRLIRGFAYGLINALHNQRLLVSFVDKPLVRTDVPHLIHVSRASSSLAMHTKRESKIEFL